MYRNLDKITRNLDKRLNCPWIRGEITTEIRKYIENNENNNTPYKYLRNVAKKDSYRPKCIYWGGQEREEG